MCESVFYAVIDKAIVKAAATVAAVTGNVSQPIEKSSVVTRRTHVTNDYASKKATAASDLESTYDHNIDVNIIYIP